MGVSPPLDHGYEIATGTPIKDLVVDSPLQDAGGGVERKNWQDVWSCSWNPLPDFSRSG